MQAQRNCDERIGEHLASRIADFTALNAAAGVYDPQAVRDVATEHHAQLSSLDALPSDEWSDAGGYTQRTADEMSEAARERIYEYPLGVSSMTVHRIDLSTGGPGDWLEVFVDEGDVRRIVYHFVDWFDHAERTLEGDDFDAAEAFASNFIEELM